MKKSDSSFWTSLYIDTKCLTLLYYYKIFSWSEKELWKYFLSKSTSFFITESYLVTYVQHLSLCQIFTFKSIHPLIFNKNQKIKEKIFNSISLSWWHETETSKSPSINPLCLLCMTTTTETFVVLLLLLHLWILHKHVP